MSITRHPSSFLTILLPVSFFSFCKKFWMKNIPVIGSLISFSSVCSSQVIPIMSRHLLVTSRAHHITHITCWWLQSLSPENDGSWLGAKILTSMLASSSPLVSLRNSRNEQILAVLFKIYQSLLQLHNFKLLDIVYQFIVQDLHMAIEVDTRKCFIVWDNFVNTHSCSIKIDHIKYSDHNPHAATVCCSIILLWKLWKCFLC